MTLDAIAARLDTAALMARATHQITHDDPGFCLADAYAVQARLIDLRIGRGERLIGVKMGFTSRAKALQMGVDDVIWGRLTDAMGVLDGDELDLTHYVHPRIEPEVAFRLGRRLSGPVGREEAAAAVEAVAPALEIIDSRYADFKFAVADVVADNSSSSAFVLGAWHEPLADLSDIAMTMAFDRITVQAGSTAAILDDPLNALCAAARLAGESGLSLEPGWIVLAGAATPAEALKPGVCVTLDAGPLGQVGVRTA
ncbi:2-keto-4-pentenoate hydratase [Caulobacter sp. ErkDOM-YI]|uniref:2-keto-4-pentenoate hydratase n=1 Tax=unclassified Caulobacter TaxID=2648921 RepID=UPI003AF54344